MESSTGSYNGVGRLIRRYWRIYGGWRAIFSSLYLHVSLVLLLVSFRLWSCPGWWEQVISVAPNLLGFTLGGFAIFLAIGDERFKATISGADPDEQKAHSPYMALCATFLHFVLIQFLALVAALVGKATYFQLPALPDYLGRLLEIMTFAGWMFSYWLFLYAVTLIAAAALATFRLATWYEQYQTINKKNE